MLDQYHAFVSVFMTMSSFSFLGLGSNRKVVIRRRTILREQRLINAHVGGFDLNHLQVGPTVEVKERDRRFSPMFQNDADAVGIGDVQIEGVVDSIGQFLERRSFQQSQDADEFTSSKATFRFHATT